MAKDKPKDPSWMAAFDRLPPEVRAAYREANYDRWDPREALPFTRFMKPAQVAANIRQQDLNLFQERYKALFGGVFRGEQYEPLASHSTTVADRAEARARKARRR